MLPLTTDLAPAASASGSDGTGPAPNEGVVPASAGNRETTPGEDGGGAGDGCRGAGPGTGVRCAVGGTAVSGGPSRPRNRGGRPADERSGAAAAEPAVHGVIADAPLPDEGPSGTPVSAARSAGAAANGGATIHCAAPDSSADRWTPSTGARGTDLDTDGPESDGPATAS